MARLQSQADLMHVPTPDVVIDRLRALLHIPEHCHAIDPCCGTGEAIVSLVPNGRLYGIELDIDRANEATKRLDHVLSCSMQDARVGNDAFGLMLLNPPYDASVDGRLELLFLDRCTRYVRPGGVLVLIVKLPLYYHLSFRLCRQFDVIGHWRFPDGYYSGPHLAFGQSVLVAKRRFEPTLDRDPTSYWYNDLRLRGGSEPIDAAIEPLPATFEKRIAVPLGAKPRVFISGALNHDDLLKLINASTLSRRMAVPSTLGCGRPPVALKQGHIALTLASGMINGVYGEGPNLHVAKGMVVRQVNTTQEFDETAGGRLVMVEKTTDSFAIKMRALTADGVIHDMGTVPPRAAAKKGGE